MLVLIPGYSFRVIYKVGSFGALYYKTGSFGLFITKPDHRGSVITKPDQKPRVRGSAIPAVHPPNFLNFTFKFLKVTPGLIFLNKNTLG